MPDALHHGGRKVIVVTDGRADAGRIKTLEAQIGRVVVAGDERVEATFVARMAAAGCRMISFGGGAEDRPHAAIRRRAGPTLSDPGQPPPGRPSFLQHCRGGTVGGRSRPALRFLYHDVHGVDGTGQLFGCYGGALGASVLDLAHVGRRGHAPRRLAFQIALKKAAAPGRPWRRAS